VQLAVVYSREQDGVESHFGTTGYTMKNTFVLFDRETESVWYPGQDGALNAVAGQRMGDSIPTAAKAEVLPLEAWLERHPDSKILQPPPSRRRSAASSASPEHPTRIFPPRACTVTHIRYHIATGKAHACTHVVS
jgi:hypothetical protein